MSIIVVTPGRSSPIEEPASPDLLQPIRGSEPAAVPVALPTYVFSPMYGEVPLSTSPVSLVPVPRTL